MTWWEEKMTKASAMVAPGDSQRSEFSILTPEHHSGRPDNKHGSRRENEKGCVANS